MTNPTLNAEYVWGAQRNPYGLETFAFAMNAKKRFSIQHFHAGFANAQYFYSGDSKETLLVPYDAIEGLPSQLSKEVNDAVLERVEAQ